MLITLDNQFAKYVDIIDKETGKSILDAGILLTEWDTKSKIGKERRWMNNSGDDNSKNFLGLDVETFIPNAKTVIKIPKSSSIPIYVISLLATLLRNEDVEFNIDN